MTDTSISRGPGLFAIDRSDGTESSTFITNVRRLAGRERPPGSVLIAAATWLLAILDAGLLYVSFDAQYTYIFAVKNARIPAMIEAAMLDAGMIILSALGIGLAMRGKASKAERFLIMICSAASAGMNFAAANPGQLAVRGRLHRRPGVPGHHHRPGHLRHPPPRPARRHRIRVGLARTRHHPHRQAVRPGRPLPAAHRPRAEGNRHRPPPHGARRRPGPRDDRAQRRHRHQQNGRARRPDGQADDEAGNPATGPPSSSPPRSRRSCPGTGATRSTGSGKAAARSPPSSRPWRACRQAPAGPTSPRNSNASKPPAEVTSRSPHPREASDAPRYLALAALLACVALFIRARCSPASRSGG